MRLRKSCQSDFFSEYDHGNYYKVQGLGFRVKKKMETIRMGYIGTIGYIFFGI